MDYTHEKVEASIAALTSAASDQEIAALLADYFTRGRPGPFTLTINHNGKVSPCPLRIDRVMTKGCVVTLRDRAAHTWIIDALTRGYEVSCMTMRGHETRSIAIERSSIEHRLRMAAYRAKRQAGELDDDIPF